MSLATNEKVTDRIVLLVISCGLILLLLAIIAGIFLVQKTLPNWAENVLVSIGTAAILKLGDCLATLIALSTGRSVERLGTQLGNTMPNAPAATLDASKAAEETAQAATDKAEEISAAVPGITEGLTQ